MRKGNKLFVKGWQYIRIENPLHKQFEKASKREVLELATLRYSLTTRPLFVVKSKIFIHISRQFEIIFSNYKM